MFGTVEAGVAGAWAALEAAAATDPVLAAAATAMRPALPLAPRCAN